MVKLSGREFSLLISVIVTVNTDVVWSCLITNNEGGLPVFQNYGAELRILRYHQVIVPSFRFDCCGNITEWGVDVHPGGSSVNRRYTLDLQVWRPSPTVDDSFGTGYYSLVGSNRFTSISLRNLVARVTPSPQDYILFQPDDVLGFYVEEARQDDDGVVLLTSSSFTRELVWYGSIAPTMATSQNGGCPYSVGSSGLLNTLIRAAPVVSIATNSHACPPLSVQTIQTPSCSVIVPSQVSRPAITPSPSLRGNNRGGNPPTDNDLSSTSLLVTLTIGTVLVLTIISIFLFVGFALRVKKRRKMRFIPMATNVAYGFVPRGEETQSIQSELLSTAHDYPTSSQQCTSSLTYNEAYITNTSPLERKEEFRANFHDANDVLDHVDYLG